MYEAQKVLLNHHHQASYNKQRISKTSDRVVYVDSYEKAKEWLLKNAKVTDTILCLGAGLDNNKLIY